MKRKKFMQFGKKLTMDIKSLNENLKITMLYFSWK